MTRVCLTGDAMTVLATDDILTERDFERISDLVYRHCGINLHDGKRELVHARLAKQLRAGGFATVADYFRHIEADASGESFHDLIDSLSTNLTSFFREPEHFRFFQSQFLPGLLSRKRAHGETRIRGWSAGCSSGEEPYTIAITLLDALDRAGAWDAKLLATDLSRRVLRTAIEGRYDKKRVEAVTPQQKSRYFVSSRADGQTTFEVAPALKQMISFRYLNLMETWPFTGPLDFIFCRNVMIYFDKPTQQTLVNRFWQCLSPGGLLFTGHSESLTGITHPFKYVQPTIYAKG